jgi:hypothetical protein
MEISGQLHAPAAFPREKSPRYPLDRRLGGPQSRCGSCEEKTVVLPEIEPGLPSPSLYQLSYPGSIRSANSHAVLKDTADASVKAGGKQSWLLARLIIIRP